MNDKLLGAIDSAVSHGIPLVFSYQGKERVACVYLLAITKDERLVCHGLQIGGNTSKGALKAPEWRFFYLDQFDTVPVASVAPFIPPPLAKAELPSFIDSVISRYTE